MLINEISNIDTQQGRNSPPQIKWGVHHGAVAIRDVIAGVYSEIVKWKPNIFTPPRGEARKKTIQELTRILSLFEGNSPWKEFSLQLAVIFLPLMLQRPHSRSRPREHTRFFSSRLKLWQSGDIEALLKEAKAIQAKLLKTPNKRGRNTVRRFTQLMFEGKISAATRLINSADNTSGVHAPTPEVLELLKGKHPQSEPAKDEALLVGEQPDIPDPVVFEGIDAKAIYRSAKLTFGSGGPSQVDADIWKQLLCSNFYKADSEELCTAISIVAKLFCTTTVPHEHSKYYMASRLIPLNKDPSSVSPAIRPIGVGEVLRRVIGRAVTQHLKDDVQAACGTLQTAAGIPVGLEASIHAVKEIFEDNEVDAVMLVDADIAFNRLNRKVALHNLSFTCPSIACFFAKRLQQ